MLFSFCIFSPPGECKSQLASVKFDSLASLASVKIILFPPLHSHFGYIEKRSLSMQPIPYNNLPSAIGKTGLMACIYTVIPAVSRKLGNAGARVFVD